MANLIYCNHKCYYNSFLVSEYIVTVRGFSNNWSNNNTNIIPKKIDNIMSYFFSMLGFII